MLHTTPLQILPMTLKNGAFKLSVSKKTESVWDLFRNGPVSWVNAQGQVPTENSGL